MVQWHGAETIVDAAIGCEGEKMSVADKFDLVGVLVKEHNEALGGSSSSGYVDLEAFVSCIKAQGGTKDEVLKSFRYEDIEKCLPNITTPSGETVKPTFLAKEIAKIFRGKEDSSVGLEDKKPISGKKADRMTPRELVEAFDPEDCDSPVGQRLKSMSRGEAFIVFKDGRIVDVENTLKLLLEVKSGFQGRDVVDTNGKIGVSVYKIGQLPDNYAEENPIFVGRPLRPDGTCCQTNRSWEGVSQEVRQFIRIAVTSGFIESNYNSALNTLDLAIIPDAMNKLRERYRKVAAKFDELSKLGDLPKLKIPLASKAKPFDDGKKVYWQASPLNTFYRGRN